MNILPRIKSYQELDGQWKIGKALKVKGDMGFLKLGINLLKNHYSAFDIAVEEGGEDASIFAERITERSGEANEYYELEITERKLVVRYTDMLSFRNAAATIIALTQSLRGEFFIRCCRLEDYADFSHRGFMLDALCTALQHYAAELGLVFQIVDDILDVTATTEELGKPVGSDAENDKTTFITLYGLEGARSLAKQHNDAALAALADLGPEADFLREMAVELLTRSK